MSWDYRSIEGALYRLGSPPEPRYTRPASLPSRQPAASRDPLVPGGTRRLDLALAATMSLDPEERQAIEEHYVRGTRRHPYGIRARAVRKIQVVLNDGAPVDGIG